MVLDGHKVIHVQELELPVISINALVSITGNRRSKSLLSSPASCASRVLIVGKGTKPQGSRAFHSNICGN